MLGNGVLKSCAMAKLHILRLPKGATLETINHALQQRRERFVLLVLPANAQHLLAEAVDMARVKQQANEVGKRIGVVSLDNAVHRAGRLMNVPVYRFVWWGKRCLPHERVWWLPQQARHSGKLTTISQGDRDAMRSRLMVWPRWMQLIYRYVTVVVFCLTVAILFVAAYYALPQATITLKPTTMPIQIAQQIVADPRYDADVASGATVPGRLLVLVDKWRATVATTSHAEVPASAARGTVTFVNRLPQVVSVPAGTRVSTSTGERIIYQTVRDAEAPAKIGGEVDVEVVAIDLGPQGNIPADLVNRIEGSLSAQLGVRNLWPMSGGASRFALTVTDADRERLQEHVIETILAAATARMEEDLLEDEFLATDSVRIVAIYEETYSHFVGEESADLTMEIRAEIHATAVSESLALELVNEQLIMEVPDGFSIMPDTIQTRIGELQGVDGAGRVSLEMLGEAVVLVDLSMQDALNDIRGQDIPVAIAHLNEQLPLSKQPTVEVWPERFGRIPFLSARIYTQIDTSSQ